MINLPPGSAGNWVLELFQGFGYLGSSRLFLRWRPASRCPRGLVGIPRAGNALSPRYPEVDTFVALVESGVGSGVGTAYEIVSYLSLDAACLAPPFIACRLLRTCTTTSNTTHRCRPASTRRSSTPSSMSGVSPTARLSMIRICCKRPTRPRLAKMRWAFGKP